jgi:hypothetical protein
MIKDHLLRLLTPDDDGRAFVDAVLLSASGALHRRRTAAQAPALPPLAWLERWARPWVVAALVGVALAAALPVLPSREAQTAAEAAPPAEALMVMPFVDDVLALAPGN